MQLARRMKTHALYSKATIMGHPIHPMLVGFPIAFYTGGIASVIAYSANADPFWLRLSIVLLVAGVVGGLVAAIFGAIDLFGGVPRETPARRTGYIHASLNVANLGVFAATAGILYSRWTHWYGYGAIKVGGPIVLGLIGIGLLLAAGAFGWKLVQTHHVGVDNGPIDRELNEPAVVSPRV